MSKYLVIVESPKKTGYMGFVCVFKPEEETNFSGSTVTYLSG